MTCCLVYFFTAWLTWRYHAFHFYEPCYDSGGKVWETMHNLMLWTIWFAAFFTACVFIAMRRFWVGGSELCVATFMIYVFWRFMKTTVVRYTVATPAQAVKTAPLTRLPREAFLPPPLRRMQMV